MANFNFLWAVVCTTLLYNVNALSSTTRYLNSTSPSSAASNCCFVVQDQVSEVYWQRFITKTYYAIVNLTSITTYVTPYPTTTLSAITTNVYTTNASFPYSSDVATNPIGLYYNNVRAVSETIKSLNGSQIVTAGITVNSPTAFNVYPTLKVIHVPAVKDSKGNLVCATVSSFASAYTGVSQSYTSIPISTRSDKVTLTATLYTTSDEGLISAIKTATVTTVDPITENSYKVSTGGAFTSTYDAPTFTANSNAEEYFSTQSGNSISATVLSLATPYIYFPTRGSPSAQADDTKTPSGPSCGQFSGPENYGYPAQQALDFAASQFPELASCLPAGPAVISGSTCRAVSPETQGAGGDLTSSTVITVTPTGAAPTPTNPPPVVVTQPDPTPAPKPDPQPVPNTPTTQPPANIPSPIIPSPVNNPAPVDTPTPANNPAPVDTPTLVNNPAPVDTPTPVNNPAPVNNPSPVQNNPSNGADTPGVPGTTQPANPPTQNQVPAEQNQNSNSGQGQSNNQGGTSNQGQNQNPAQGGASSQGQNQNQDTSNASQGQNQNPAQGGASSQGQNQAPAQGGSSSGQSSQDQQASTPASADENLGSLIASLVGVSPISTPTGTANPLPLANSDGATIPLMPGLPSNLPTTIISGTPNVVLGVSGAVTSIPIPSALPSSLAGLVGSTTVIPASGNAGPSTYLVLTGATTIPIPSQIPYPTTVISGTPNIILGSPALKTSIPITAPLPSGFTGSTTVVSASGSVGASTYLVLTGATTIPVPGVQTSGSPSSKTTLPNSSLVSTSGASSATSVSNALSISSASSNSGGSQPPSTSSPVSASSATSLPIQLGSILLGSLIASLVFVM